MNHRPAVRAAAPFAALVAAVSLVLTLAPTSPAPGAAGKRDGSLDVALADAPPPDPHGPRPAHPRGAIVLDVESGGAGDRAGLVEGDLIIEFENVPVTSAAALAGMIRRKGEGSLVSIWVWRDGSRKWMGLTHLSGRVPRARIEEELTALRAELGDLRDEVAALRDDVDALRDELARVRPRRVPARAPSGESPTR